MVCWTLSPFQCFKNFWVRVNQRLYFPLSTTYFMLSSDFPLSAFRPNVTLACYQQVGKRKESPLTLAESRAVGLPWPRLFYQILWIPAHQFRLSKLILQCIENTCFIQKKEKYILLSAWKSLFLSNFFLLIFSRSCFHRHNTNLDFWKTPVGKPLWGHTFSL